VLSTSAQALDILTLRAEAPAVNVPVAMELIVNGVLSPGFVRANSSLSFGVLGELDGSDFGYTALLRLILPAGVSLTASESGTFGVPLPIPEPQTYALMLAGFALLAFKALRRAGGSSKG
jgi:hypothetical protein